MKKIILILVFILVSNAGDVEIQNATIKAPPPFAKVSAGFMKLKSKLAKDLKLIKVESDFSEHTELHDMDMKNGMMRMYKIDSATIPAKSSMSFESGGKHIMFIGLKEKLKPNSKKKLKLSFDNGKTMDTWFEVKKF